MTTELDAMRADITAARTGYQADVRRVMTELQAHADAFSRAIGEVSAGDAWAAFLGQMRALAEESQREPGGG